MINYFSRMLVNIKKGDRGSSPQKIILIFAGVLVGGFILANLTLGSALNLYSNANGALANNILVSDIQTTNKNFATLNTSSGDSNKFLMFDLDYPSILKQLFAYGGDALNSSLGGNK